MMTRLLRFRALLGGMLAMVLSTAGWAGVFGRVVPIGGQASDIALDEARGVLYIANFPANRIEVMNLADLTITRSINVNPLPNSISLSPDGQYLLVAHFGNVKPPDVSSNTLTLINLDANTKQTFGLGASPLAVAFGADGQALVVTAAEISTFDPSTGSLRLLDTIASLATKTLPQPGPAFPTQITESAIGVSGDGRRMYGSTEAFGFTYDVNSRVLGTFPTKGGFPEGPRAVSVSQDGSYFAFGWAIWDSRGRYWNNFTNITGAYNVGSYALDFQGGDPKYGTIYAQLPEAVPSGPAGPILQVLDLDNATVRERLKMPENLAGKSLLNSRRDVVYAISDSGVMVLPVGSLSRARRVVASKEDVIFRGNLCDHRMTTQQITITDPGGGSTDFALTPSNSAIRVSPSVGVTPATVRISVDTTAYQNQRGTISESIQIQSAGAVNVPSPVRVLINNQGADQRGAVVNVPGQLTDVLADPVRDRFYILRKDKNQILVFDGSKYTQIATLRTNKSPSQMAITRDAKYLLVGHDLAWNANVYDLDTLEQEPPVEMPYAHYPFSIAVSGGAILAVADNRSVGRGYNTIDRIDLGSRSASELATLGPFENKFTSYVALTASPNGGSILGAAADGTVVLYDANADAFTTLRKDLPVQAGPYAASSANLYVVGNTVLNASLVPLGTLETGTGASSGFAFMDQGAVRTTGSGPASPGVIQRVDLTRGLGIRPTLTVEAPLPSNPSSGTTTNPNPFTRTLAPLSSRSAIISLTQSGFTVVPWNYDAAVPTPQLTRVVNAADQTQAVAPGGLITIAGRDLSAVNVATSEIPLPTALAESCLSVNGVTVPLILVSSSQINAQLPFTTEGKAQMVLRTPGGVSNNYNFTILPNAPSVFRSGDSSIASIVRDVNNETVSEANPVRQGDDLTIFATGLGRTSPAIEEGLAAPSDPPASALASPEVTLDGAPMAVKYAGLKPGEVGVYQINVTVPGGVTPGARVPLTIRQGAMTTTLAVQVVE